MAKWGEGDPRWIVEERPDATNVNNWHWTEKNASEWSKAKLKVLFEGLKFNIPGFGEIKVEEVAKCEGEASLSNRKGKLIVFYEWVLQLKWAATLASDPSLEINGKIDIPNLSEENQPDEITVDVSTSIGGETGDKFKEYIRLKGVSDIQEKCKDYIEAIRNEYAQDVLLPTTNYQKKDDIVSQELINNVHNIKVSNSLLNTTKKDNSSGVKLEAMTLSQQRSFKCTAEEFYRVITVREMVVAFTRSEVKLDAQKGGSFSLFHGNILGEFVTLDPPSKIVQKWRFKTWPSGHFAEVTLNIKEENGETIVDLKQTGIPSNDFERTKSGWDTYYWESIKRTFGFGATLM